MTRKIYKCVVCGSLTAILSQGSGSLSCCGVPLIDRGGSGFQEDPVTLIDLVEVRHDGKSRWQFQLPKSPVADWMNGGRMEKPSPRERAFV